MSNPLEDFLTEYGPVETKEADLKGFGRQFGGAVTSGLGAATATAALGAGAVGVKALYDAATSGRDFRAMLSHNEDLRDHHTNDPRRVNQLYSSLRSMNPNFAKDPIVAGTYMRRMIDSPLGAGGILAETVGARSQFPSILDRAEDDAISASRSHFSRKPGSGGDRRDGPSGDGPPRG